VGSLAQYKINNLLGRFDEKQQVERAAVLKKIQSGKDDINKKKERDIQSLVNRYKALKENQLQAQRAEIHSLEKDFMSFNPSSNLYGKTLRPEPLAGIRNEEEKIRQETEANKGFLSRGIEPI